MKKIKNILLVIASFTCMNAYAQPTIIFDTDFGGDADDLGALAMLNHFIDKGECNLLAVMCWSTEASAVAAVDAMNRFYKHTNIPIGVRKGDSFYVDWNYSKPIADRFTHQLNYDNVPDATILYRKLLAASKDGSLTIVTVGPLKNIENLLNSMPDSLSTLSGKELIKKKVKEFIIMGGQFPEGPKEWNFDGGMPGVTKFVLENIPVPIVFSGFEVGVEIKTGNIFNTIDKNSPLYVGFMHFSKNAPWVKDNFKGMIINNATYDQTAVLYAVRNGVGNYWDKVCNGICKPNNDEGGNTWIPAANSNQCYLTLKKDKKEMATLIESLMIGKF